MSVVRIRHHEKAVTIDGLSDDEIEHVTVMLAAAKLYAERNRMRKGVWRRSGFRGQIFHVFAKAERLFIRYVGARELPDEQDDILDIINYATFAARLMHDGETEGSWPWHG